MIEQVQKYDTSRPWSAKTVARFLGYSVPYTYTLVRKGVLPARKVRGRWFFNPADVLDYVGLDLSVS